MDTWTIIAICAALVIGIALFVLYKKGILDGETIHGTSAIMQGLPIEAGGSLFGLILEYSRTAVLTVEQLVKTGAINRDDKTRKETAMQIVQNAADVDGVPFGAAEIEAASNCIEAEVRKLPRNQQTPTTLPPQAGTENPEE